MAYPEIHGKIVRNLVFAGLVAMFVASGVYFFTEHSLVVLPASPQTAQEQDNEGMGFGLSSEATDSLGRLMLNLQANPNDHNLLLQIAEIFMSAKEWEQAEGFIRKAMISAPKNSEARIFYSIVRYQQNDFQGAATALEDLLKISPDEPVAIFNLATIYKHSLNEPAKAIPLFKEIIEKHQDEADLVELAKKELE